MPPEAMGCKLWSLCQGRCETSTNWRTPCKLPPIAERPTGVHTQDHRIDGCPVKVVRAEEWSLLRLWSAWRTVGGPPYPGSAVEQPARVVEAIQVLEGERMLIEAAQRSLAERRSRLGQKG